MKLRSEVTVEVGGEELELEVRGEFHPGTPDVWYLKNGDPGHPGDPAEVDIHSITHNGAPVTLTDEEMEKVIDAVITDAMCADNDICDSEDI